MIRRRLPDLLFVDPLIAIRGTALLLAVALSALLPFGADAQATPSAATSGTVDDLSWMAGCWVRTSGDRTTEEMWTLPAGGVMLGVSRTVRGGTAVEWEHLLLHARDGVLAYRASPSGQATAEFAALHVSDSLAVFENPMHDFPQRILYRPAAGDSLHARVEGPGPNGTREGVDFRYGRGRCPG